MIPVVKSGNRVIYELIIRGFAIVIVPSRHEFTPCRLEKNVPDTFRMIFILCPGIHFHYLLGCCSGLPNRLLVLLLRCSGIPPGGNAFSINFTNLLSSLFCTYFLFQKVSRPIEGTPLEPCCLLRASTLRPKDLKGLLLGWLPYATPKTGRRHTWNFC